MDALIDEVLITSMAVALAGLFMLIALASVSITLALASRVLASL